MTWFDIILAATAALMVGFAKTGLPGLAVLFAAIMASVFPAKESVGVLLPLLLLADVFAVAWYRRHAQWRVLAGLFPWTFAGIVLAFLALGKMGDREMGLVLGGLVILMVALQIARQSAGGWLHTHLPHTWWFLAAMGVLAGFTTMLGNLAGPVLTIYLMAKGFQKYHFMGTAAWFFLVVNAVKVPLMAWRGMITPATLVFDLKAAAVVVAGAVLGILVFRHIPQKWFSRAILALAALAAARLIVTALLKAA